jgi:hypothetical protein
MDLTTLAVAAVGLAGTLTSPLIGQRIAAQTKRQEFHFETERRRAELEEARRQSALELKRSIYARLNTAARQYRQELEAYVREIRDHSLDDSGQAAIASARKNFRDVYSEAQMVLPDKVLDAAISVSEDLGEAYGISKRLEIGKPRTIPGKGPETLEMAGEAVHVTAYDCIARMRQLMREDLGVAAPGTQLTSGPSQED